MIPATISTVICDVPDKARLIFECVSGKEHTVKAIVLMEAFDSELVTQGQKCGIEVLSLSAFEVRATRVLLI